jgi:hypothetical protein
MAVLQLGLAGGRPVKAVLADALAGKPLPPNDWRLLAFYSWETDEQQLVTKADLPATLVKLAVASPASDGETTTRLWLKALAASNEGQGLKPDAALRERVLRVLADPAAARAQMDVLTSSADDIVRTLEAPGSAGRAPLMAAFDTALKRLEADATLSRADRLGALNARVDLARVDEPKDTLKPDMPTALLADVQQHVARADREISDGYERQAVITAAAYTLTRAGLWNESDALLKANLARSHSPYYLMSQLGGNARKQGRKEEALRWYEQAYARSEGPATRLQWGSGYLTALVDLAPQDAKRIEKTARQLISDAGRDRGAFEGRSVRSLQRASNKLVDWGGEGKQPATLKRLQAQLGSVCPKVEAAEGRRAACEALLKPAAKKAA